jgi:hypothetical protein
LLRSTRLTSQSMRPPPESGRGSMLCEQPQQHTSYDDRSLKLIYLKKTIENIDSITQSPLTPSQMF